MYKSAGTMHHKLIQESIHLGKIHILYIYIHFKQQMTAAVNIITK